MARNRGSKVLRFFLRVALGRPGTRGSTLTGFLLVILLVLVFQGAGNLVAQTPAGEEGAAAEGEPADPAQPAEGAPAEGTPAAGEDPAPGGDPAAGEASPAADPGAGEAPPAEGDPAATGEAPAEGEEPPPPPGDAEKMLDEANGLVQGGKFDEAVDLLRGKDDAFASEPRLLTCYLEALIGAATPNWMEIERQAAVSLAANPEDRLSNYCMGRALAEKKKPNLAKALEHLAKAKTGKKAFKDAGTIYWKVWAKKNWTILAGALGGLIVVVIKVSQKRKATKMAAELQALADLSAGAAGEGGTAGASSEAGSATPAAPDKPAESKKAEEPKGKPAPAKKAEDPKKAEDTKKADDAKKAEDARKGEEAKAKAAEPPPTPKLPPRPTPVTEAEATKPTEPKPAPTKSAVKPAEEKPEPPKPAGEAAKPPAPEKKSVPPREAPPAIEEMDLATAAKVREALESPARPVIPAGANVDGVWDKLCRKALAQPMPVDFQPPAGGPLPGARASQPGGWAAPGETSGSLSGPGGSGGADLSFLGDNLDVTIDLSEEGLKEDLLGKLKMLAITDGDLRKLLLQRNPDHIPNLVEYILTRPDPVRLAFVAREMGNYHDPAVTDVLASLLYQEDQRVVLGAVQGLQTNGGNAAILHLCPFVQSGVPAIAEAARNALASFGAKRILEAFYHLPANPDERIRAAGVYVLARMRGEQVSRILNELLYDQSLLVRKEVMLAMAFQKDPAYLTGLREFARKATSEDDKKMARKAIVYLQGFVPPAARSGTGPHAA